MDTIARSVDLFSSSLLFGATAWFFFIQSAAALKFLGREKFVPLQMSLTKTLFKALEIMAGVSTVMSIVHSGFGNTTLLAIFGLANTMVNKHVIVPKALIAGGKARKTLKGKDKDVSSVSAATDGLQAGQDEGNNTKTLHRTVVVFVVLMLVGFVPHMLDLIGIHLV